MFFALYVMADKFMQMAIDEARQGITKGHGGPFGTVIVKNGEVIGRGHNRVLKAAYNEDTFDLSGAELYTTGEPCPMCLCACLWANIRKVYYGCTIADNERIGFRDAKFERVFAGREKLEGYMEEVDREACLALFDEYAAQQHRLY